MAAENPPEDVSSEAQEAFSRYLLSRSHGTDRSFDDLLAQHPELASELRSLRASWSKADLGGSHQSLRERIRARRGKDLDPCITLEPAGEGDSAAPDQAEPDGGSGSSSRILERIRKERTDTTRYRINGEIARGGMGAILKVWDEDLRRSLAMKVVLGRGEDECEVDDGKLSRFLEEAQITGQLDHPGVVPVHEIGIGSDGRAFFTMQLVKGRDLKEIFGLVRAGSEGWNLTRALNVILRVCEAMAFAHEKKVIHRDIKPANVMVGRFGETYVMDWGLAKVLGREDSHDVRIQTADQVSLSIVQTDRGDSTRSSDSPLVTMDGDVVGTPCYMSPEQARGVLEDIGPHSDVYAVGALLYELLTGFAPYMTSGERISPVAVLGMVLQGPPAAIDSLDNKVPSELTAICEKAMAREPRDRYPSMLAMAEDLRAFLENRVVGAYETGALAEFKKWVGRNRGMAAALAAAVLAAVLGLGAVTAVQARANSELKATNDQLSTTRDQLASSNDELGAANDDLREATQLALEKEREAQFLSYSANLAAASASLAAGDILEAERRLSLCPEPLRGWEWHRLQLETDSSTWSKALDRKGVGFLPYTDMETDPSSDRAVLATAWKTIQIVSILDGETLVEFDHPRSATTVAFTPDGRQIVSSASDRRFYVWDAADGTELRSFKGHRSAVKDNAVSPDGTRMVSIGIDKYVRLWDFATGDELARLKLPSAGLSVAWSPDGTRFATGAQDRLVRIHDGTSAEVIHELEGHLFSVVDVNYDATGRFLASAGARSLITGQGPTRATAGRAIVWDAAIGREVAGLSGLKDGVTSVTFLPDGDLVAASLEGSLRHFEVGASHSNAFWGHPGHPVQIAVSRDGSSALTTGSEWNLRGWDLACTTGLSLAPHPKAIVGVRAAGNGELVSVSRDGMLKAHDPLSGALLYDFRDHPQSSLGLAVASDGTLVASLAANLAFSGVTPSAGFLLGIWELDARRTISLSEFEAGLELDSIAISADGEVVVTAADRRLFVTAGRTGELLREIELEPVCLEMVLSPDGRYAVTHMSDGASRLWDVETGELLDDQFPGSRRMRFLADGNMLARVLDTTVELAPFVPGASLEDRTAIMLQGHGGEVQDVAMTPDRARVATAGEDGTVRIWDPRRGDLLLTLDELGSAPTSLDFLPDGERLAVGLEDGRVRILFAHRSEESSQAYREARRLASTAHRVLAPLFEQEVDPGQVAERLRADDALDGRVRDAALIVTARIPTSDQQLEDEAWPLVKAPTNRHEELEELVWKARYTLSHDPENENALSLLGMASYRLGRYDQAVEPLESSDEIRTRTRRARPEVAACLAMVHHRLGNDARAADYLDRLRSLMSINVFQSNTDSLALLAEAEQLLKR